MSPSTYTSCATDWKSLQSISSTSPWTTCGTTTTSLIGHTVIKYNNYTLSDLEEAFFEGGGNPKDFEIRHNRVYRLPDEARLKVDDKGNYEIEDKDAKVTYLANNIREFSPYLNASDLLAKFVKYVGDLGLRRQEVLKLPIELFISWLILEAAKKDGDPIPDNILPIQNDPVIKINLKPRCLVCGKFIKRRFAETFKFCNPSHGELYFSRNLLTAN